MFMAEAMRAVVEFDVDGICIDYHIYIDRKSYECGRDQTGYDCSDREQCLYKMGQKG